MKLLRAWFLYPAAVASFAIGILFAAFTTDRVTAQAINAWANVSPADQAAITVTSKMLGLAAIANQGGCVLRPQTTGRVSVTISGEMANNTGGDGGRMQLAWGPAATAPANGASLPTGWTAVGVADGLPNGGLTIAGQSVQWIIGGLTAGTLYGFDILVTIVTGGTETISKVNCSMWEGMLWMPDPNRAMAELNAEYALREG